MLGSQTAKVIKIFKTTQSEMSEGFTSEGASATVVGVSMSEQIGVLGTLKATMSGSVSGTKYRTFLSGISKVQHAININFLDSQHKLLPIVDTFNILKARYSDVISIAESAELSKAFGTQEATSMLNLLMQNTNGLKISIAELEKDKGLRIAEEMAADITDQLEHMQQSIFATWVAIASALLPAIIR
ncbi:phage tail tape measure protein [Candidatus Enterovibrio escicola]|uniref:Phage tail length tape-measure protein n=2 Tax=Candidatus Enterovibrio escicola TaxID=1927127 RepID=A0A2A5T3L0_9GAMM|nr:phage tail tape measure protein [Candidatus Enterovibrio escacola]PCS22710.1 Phage tail length tape-measure protein [Candidatus Enterovibrio escacola]